MPTAETISKAGEWVTRLNTVHGIDGVAHEVAAVWSEQQVMSERAKRYSLAIHEAQQVLTALFDETGDERIIDAARWLEKVNSAAEYGDNWEQLQLAFQ